VSAFSPQNGRFLLPASAPILIRDRHFCQRRIFPGWGVDFGGTPHPEKSLPLKTALRAIAAEAKLSLVFMCAPFSLLCTV
jgi:hypothetical protein